MSTLTERQAVRYMDAIREGIADEMRQDERVVPDRDRRRSRRAASSRSHAGSTRSSGPTASATPRSPRPAFVGAAVGAAATGLGRSSRSCSWTSSASASTRSSTRPSKLRYMTGGPLEFPLVVRTQTGAGRSSGAQHSQSLEAIVAHIPGLKVVMPATVDDAYGLMRAAIRDDNPVVYIENRRLYGRRGDLRTRRRAAADRARPGSRAAGATSPSSPGRAWSRSALEAAETLAADGVEVGGDRPALARAAGHRDRGRLGRAHGTRRRRPRGRRCPSAPAPRSPPGSPRSRSTASAPRSRRIGAPFAPMPFSPPLEAASIPDADAVVAGVRRTMAAS